MKQFYKDNRFQSGSIALIEIINNVIDGYLDQGYKLSVRQLYYQLVARGHIANTEKSYRKIVSLLTDGRMAGLIDWDAIEDRNRDVIERPAWSSGRDILFASANSFHKNLWHGQDYRVFVIVEKAALQGVLSGVCHKYDVPLLAAKGYPSVSIVREMALEHIRPALSDGQGALVLHCGDHDPSGIDMTRDLEDRFNTFLEGNTEWFELRRIALTMDQIEEINPPPNPAKTTDSRFTSYADIYGDESWELDALEPKYLHDLVEEHIKGVIDEDKWAKRKDEIQDIKDRLTKIAKRFKD